jgi:HK97 family phage major capsid protein
MPTLQDLREQRANIWSTMTEIMERSGGVPTGEDAQAYDRAETELDALGDRIDRAERHEAVTANMNAVDRRGVVPPQRGGDVHEGQSEQDRAYAQAFDRFVCNASGLSGLGDEDRRLVQSGFVQGDAYRNAAGVGTGAAGGFLVPPEFRDRIVQALLAYGPMLQLAERLDTATGANIPWPTNDDTANEGAILAENTQITEQDVSLGTNSLDAYMYTSKLVRVSYQLMQDRPDFTAWLAGRLGERLARIYNRHATTGTGTAQPDGIVTSATVGVTGSGSLATTGGYSYDNLVDLVESLDDAYLTTIDARFMMHQSVRKALRKLKDTTGAPIWQPSVQAGTPDSLLGYPTTINNHMPTVAQNSKSLLFGDIRAAYVIRVVQQNELVRLNERYADFLQVGFFAFGRFDGTMQNASAVRVFQTTPTA